MIDVIRECRKIYSDLRRQIACTRANHVNREALRTKVRDVVDRYFRCDRPLLLKRIKRDDYLTEVDDHMRNLLRFTQSRTPKQRYLDALSRVNRAISRLELELISLFPDRTAGEVEEASAPEQAIISELSELCPVAANCYRQAVSDLQDAFRLSWRGAATELRETLREYLDRAAPDTEVTRAPGFKLDPNAKRPTMKQKARYVLTRSARGGAGNSTATDTAELVEEKFSSLVRSVYTRSSGSVHAATERGEVLSIKRFVDIVLGDLLQIHDRIAA